MKAGETEKMSTGKSAREYKSTESQYRGNAAEMYITYDLEQETRGDTTAMYPKVKRVYIAGEVNDWKVGRFEKQSGKEVFGMKIEYEQTREGYERSGYTARRSDTGTEYEVEPTRVPASKSEFTKIVELPEDAENIEFRGEDLPDKYRDALQNVR
jgi:hypothetical protein